MCDCLSHAPLTGDLACNPGMCPNWGSNQPPFGYQASAQSTEPHQPGLLTSFYREETEAQRQYDNCPETAPPPPQLMAEWGSEPGVEALYFTTLL